MNAPILRVENLTKKYQNGFMLDILQLQLASGKIFALIGPNGAGKTTLMNILSLLEEPDRGRLFFQGEEIGSSPYPRRAIRKRMSMVMENPLLFQTTVFKNIAYGLKIRGIGKTERQKIVNEVLFLVGMEGFEERDARYLSRGETQRVAIARAIVVKPEVLFLDEPFTNIDRTSIQLIEKLIKSLNQKRNATIIFSTPDIGQAYRLSDEVISLLDGRVVGASLENLFAGEIKEEGGAKWLWISPKIKLELVTNRNGKVHISIPPQDIILSSEKLQSSARNSLSGVIKKIELEGETVRVFVDVGVEFMVSITRKSLTDLGLLVGAQVFITFKATSIIVL